MKTATNRLGRRGVRTLVTAAAILATGLVAFPSTALADRDGGSHGRRHHDHGVHGGRFDRHHGGAFHHDRVPRHFHGKHLHHFQPFFHGSVFFAPHRHFHSIYRFPVFFGGHVVYRSYPYCDDDLFVSGSIFLPRLAIGVDFGSPFPPPPPYGVWIGGY